MGLRVDNKLRDTNKLTIKTQAISRLINEVYSPFNDNIEKDIKELIEKNNLTKAAEDAPFGAQLAFKDPVTGAVEGNVTPLVDPPLLHESLQEEYAVIKESRLIINDEIRKVRKYLKTIVNRAMHTDQVKELLPDCLIPRFNTLYEQPGYYENPTAFKKLRPITAAEKEEMDQKFAEEIERIRSRLGMQALMEDS